MRIRTAAAVFGGFTLIAGCSPSAETPSETTTSAPATTASAAPAEPRRGPEPSVATPVVANVLAAPVPVPATDGRVHLAYEVELTNVLAQEVTLTSLIVLDRDVSLLNLSGDQLANWTRIIGTPVPTTKIGPAQTAVVWLDVALDKGATVPSQLMHAVGMSCRSRWPPLFPATMTETCGAGDRADPQAGGDLSAARRARTGWTATVAAIWERTAWRSTRSTGSSGRPNDSRSITSSSDPDGRLFTGDQAKAESYSVLRRRHPRRRVTVRWWRPSTGCPSRYPDKSPMGLAARPVPGQPHRAGPR